MKKEVGFENRDRFVELGLMISALRKAKGQMAYNTMTADEILTEAKTRYTTHGSTMCVFQNGIYRFGLSMPS